MKGEKKEIVIRKGRASDYSDLLESEKKAWGDSGVKLISEDVFLTWLETFPEGLIIAEVENRVRGHLFLQICDFDPFDKKDNRSWATITDDGYCKKTHNPKGNTFYTVSISSCYPGAGKAMLRQISVLTDQKFNLPFAIGVCRIPGALKYANENGKTVDLIIDKYVKKVLKSAKGMGEKFFDPTLSVVASIEEFEFDRIIPNYFDDLMSGNYACQFMYKNSAFG